MDYKIVIPSLGRPQILRERTLNALSGIDKANIYIFTTMEEFDEYKRINPEYNVVIGELGCAEQKAVISNYFEEGDRLVFLDDDIKSFHKKYNSTLKLIKPTEMFDLCFSEMEKHGAEMCGIYPTKNPFYMRQKTRVGLSFCIGQCNCVINRRDLFNNFEYRILEDYERSIRYFLLSQLIRLDYIAVDADYNKLEGGWQTTSELRHVKKKEAELLRFKQQYDDYCYIKQKKESRDIIFKSIYSKVPKVVQMLWLDKGKNEIFNLAIQSWIHHGYTIDLYTNNLKMIKSKYVNHISYKEILDLETEQVLQFADLFRYKLLYEKGGLWADSDMIMVNDYNFNKDKYIISSEHTFKTGAFKSNADYKPNIGILKFPAKDPFLGELVKHIESTILDPDDCLQFMKIFQKKLQLKKYKFLNKFVKEPAVYCGVPFWSCAEMYKDVGLFNIKYGVLSPSVTMLLQNATCIHFWNNFSYNKHSIDFSSAHDDSLFSILKNRYIIQ